MLAFAVLGWLGGCAAQSMPKDDGNAATQSRPSASSSSITNTAPGTNQGTAGSGVPAGSAGAPAVSTPAPSGTTAGGTQGNGPSADGCAANLPFKKAGCSCQAGETAACWTGPAADRNIGKCHDGLQICSGNSEFASWGPCMNDELDCGTDAGVPPPPPDAGEPPPPMDCPCVPGAIIQCSEDCSTGIVCSLTASKTCMPDHTWSVCHEDLGVTLDLPGAQCRNMLHGCLDVLSDGTPQPQSEVYVGDCSSQFTCGHAPSLL